MASLKPIDLSKTIKRLEIIKSLILIEEEEEIETLVEKLEQMDITPHTSARMFLVRRYSTKIKN